MKKPLLLVFALILAVTFAGCSKPAPVDPVVPDDGQEQIVGADWRTWRSYSAECSINRDLIIVFSNLDDGEGLAVYDCSDGARIGTLIFADGGDYTLADSVDPYAPLVENVDQDDVNEVGFEMTDGSIVWYRYDPDAAPWPDNVGGCFVYLQTDIAGRPITAPIAEIDTLTAALGDKMEGKTLVDMGEEDIGGVACRVFALGTNSPEKVTIEAHYAVSPTGDIYTIDLLEGADWTLYTP